MNVWQFNYFFSFRYKGLFPFFCYCKQCDNETSFCGQGNGRKYGGSVKNSGNECLTIKGKKKVR